MLPKTYNPKAVEDKIYKLWQESGFFNPDKLPKTKGRLVIAMAPLNVTGEAHMGHALENTLMDVLVRRARMEGKKTVWVPGTDHAGIATQNVVEKQLKKEGETRFDLGREKFIKRVWQWKEKYGNIILEQLKKLGCSCDWSRTRFTMDSSYSQAVKAAFLHYYKKGWIYQGKRVVNWCPRCQTSLSDLELEYEEREGKLWYIKYPLKQKNKKAKKQTPTPLNPPSPGRGGASIIVATTRPETMLGDMAVAVNPKDKRYKALVGQTVVLPLVGREIPIIADGLVDPKFGTGAVKVTPAHDLIDYKIAQKHNLKLCPVIDKNGKITYSRPGLEYLGLSTEEARKQIIKALNSKGLLQKEEDYLVSVPRCYRCQTTIEYLPSRQWFLSMEKLAGLAKKAVKEGKIKFIPKRFEKTYLDWLNNIDDWCISRQIWWGHKIPLKGEADVLDTWFSSALWPFAMFGWPKKTRDLKEFYPTDIISSDRGIINLWQARMVFSGIELTKSPPFHTIYIHGTVLTKEGKRMSKSLGTGINPIDLIEKYGADATRFGLIWQVTGGQDIRFGEDKSVMGKKFGNKIWNASRFVLQQISNSKLKTQISKPNVKCKILQNLDKTIKSVNKNLNNFEFGKAAQVLYHFFWHDFCDCYIEQAKAQKDKERTAKILLFVLLTSLKLLHPFAPFLTEEIYQKLPIKNKRSCLMIEQWPE